MTGQAVEMQVAADMVRRSIPLVPVWLLLCGLSFGLDGAISGAFAIAVVLANLCLSALLLSRAAAISLPALMGAALGGYVIRLALVTVAVLAVRNEPWFMAVPLGATLIVTHLGLLFWETRYVSMSLAYPGLKPERGR